MTNKPYTLDRVVRLLIGLSLLVIAFLIIQRLTTVLLPFIIGWLLAYLLHPLVRFFQYTLKFKNRALAIICTLLVFILSLVGFMYLIIPLINIEISRISELNLFSSGIINLDGIIPLDMQQQIKEYVSHLNIKTMMADATIMDTIKKITPHIWSVVDGSLNFLFGLAIVIVVFMYLIFILLDYESISKNLFLLIPTKARAIMSEIIEDMEYAMNQYFRGQALIAIIVGILFAIGFSIINLPLAIVMGIMIGIFTLVPYLKTILLIPCFALGWIQALETGQSSWGIFLSIAIVFIVIQTIEDVFLVPKIMKKATGLNPAIILLSLSVWGSLMGVIGMIIALPLTTLIISYYKRFVLKEDTDEIPVATETPENDGNFDKTTPETK